MLQNNVSYSFGWYKYRYQIRACGEVEYNCEGRREGVSRVVTGERKVGAPVVRIDTFHGAAPSSSCPNKFDTYRGVISNEFQRRRRTFLETF